LVFCEKCFRFCVDACGDYDSVVEFRQLDFRYDPQERLIERVNCEARVHIEFIEHFPNLCS